MICKMFTKSGDIKLETGINVNILQKGDMNE